MAFSAPRRRRSIYGVGAGQLSREQAAKLAAMLPNPRFYDRNRGAPYLLRRAGVILAAHEPGRGALSAAAGARMVWPGVATALNRCNIAGQAQAPAMTNPRSPDIEKLQAAELAGRAHAASAPGADARGECRPARAP